MTSTPEGATIFMDGTDTGELTPHVFADLPATRYIISVSLENHFPAPTSSTVDLHPLDNAVQDFELSSQALTITSNPAGASIFLDGENSGEVTPATLFRREPGNVEVQLVLAGMYISPETVTATIETDEITELPASTFTLRPKKTVMLEGFSNVECGGCPELADNVEALMHRADYGLSQVIYCKFSMAWPWFADPFYQHNTEENNGRYTDYVDEIGSSIPVLILDGTKAEGTGENSTPTDPEIALLVDTAKLAEPGFLIDVTADFTSSTVSTEITLTAMQDVTLSDHTLFIALVQSYVLSDEPYQDVVDFHWLFRDRVDALPILDISLSAGETAVFNETLVRGDWDLDTMHVIAFVQNNTSKTILQAGISTTTVHAAAALFLDSPTTTYLTPGDDRP